MRKFPKLLQRGNVLHFTIILFGAIYSPGKVRGFWVTLYIHSCSRNPPLYILQYIEISCETALPERFSSCGIFRCAWPRDLTRRTIRKLARVHYKRKRKLAARRARRKFETSRDFCRGFRRQTIRVQYAKSKIRGIRRALERERENREGKGKAGKRA